jgi:adenylate cyclase
VAANQMKRKLAAIFSADAKGYSRLMGDDEEMTVRTLKAYRETMAAFIRKHRGRVVDSPGDNVLAEFASVVDALQCAVAVQKVLAKKNDELPESRRMAFRIGINLGDVIEDEGRIYGDGVNIAARLEGLAQPGGICLSGTAYDHVKHKVSVAFDDLGEHRVKNIREPVRVYRVLIGPLSPADEPRSPSEIPDRPSIAVLPFVNMSADPEQEYFSDGLTEDLITDLSKISALLVIARNSVFTYKGKPVKVQQVGGELGVRYVVEGSVRRAGSRVRVTAQLIDAATGAHLWAERYDRDVEDIFALQDELTHKIVGILKVKVIEVELNRLRHKDTSKLSAFECVLRGRWYSHRYTREANTKARGFYERAIELDPDFASAHAGLGWTYFAEWSNQWSQDPKCLDRALSLGKKAVLLNDALSVAHSLLGHVYLWKRQFAQAVVEKERAIALDPNDADGYADLAEVMVWTGRPDEAVGLVEKAMRLNPNDLVHYLFTLGYAYLLTDRRQEAIEAQMKAVSLNPDFLGSHVLLAAVYSELGRDDQARAEFSEVKRINPSMSLETWRQRLPFGAQAQPERFFRALKRIGME